MLQKKGQMNLKTLLEVIGSEEQKGRRLKGGKGKQTQ